MEQFIKNIAERLLGYKGFHYPVIDLQGNTSIPNLVNHVNQWLMQFDEIDRYDLARLTSYLLDHSYLEEHEETSYIASLFDDLMINKNGIVATPLLIQGNGRSQRDMVQIYNQYVKNNNLSYNPKLFIYLDDILFSGGRVYSDLTNYFANVKEDTTVIISLLGAFSYNLWKVKDKFQKKIDALFLEKQIRITIYWKVCSEYENRLARKNSSEILWPMEGVFNLIELNPYKLLNFNYRSGFNKNIFFQNHGDRFFLEKICLKYGYKIIERCGNIHTTTRPLGNSFYNYGFGGLIFNYRNCPNNTPLIFWWGSNNIASPMYQ